jgi:hypothetical protein
MQRQAISDGRWFDVDKAKKYSEDTWFDGSNHISCATGSQWEHEALYKTASGRWVLNHWSQRQGSADCWAEISEEDAARWLIKNNKDCCEACAAVSALEI